MRMHKGRAVAVGILCGVAATVAVWSGPLFAATGSLHSSGQAPAHVASGSQTSH